jgi:hypothetical protein
MSGKEAVAYGSESKVLVLPPTTVYTGFAPLPAKFKEDEALQAAKEAQKCEHRRRFMVLMKDYTMNKRKCSYCLNLK